MDRGTLPGDLVFLAPKYIPSIPADPFGDEFEYLPEKKLIRSKGMTEPIIFEIKTWK